MKWLRKIFGSTPEQKSRDNAELISGAARQDSTDADSVSAAPRPKLPDERRLRNEAKRAARTAEDARRWQEHKRTRPGARS